MTREEKEQAGKERANKNWNAISAWELWGQVTSAVRQYGRNGAYSTQGTIKLYNKNAEKYANRPVKVIECGFSNIENYAYIDRLFELVEEKINNK